MCTQTLNIKFIVRKYKISDNCGNHSLAPPQQVMIKTSKLVCFYSKKQSKKQIKLYACAVCLGIQSKKPQDTIAVE
jgi:hypothetical protein